MGAGLAFSVFFFVVFIDGVQAFVVFLFFWVRAFVVWLKMMFSNSFFFSASKWCFKGCFLSSGSLGGVCFSVLNYFCVLLGEFCWVLLGSVWCF